MELSLAQGVGLDLVCIPSGLFWMGSTIWGDNERPMHQMYLPEFWMGKYPVTVRQYAAFVRARNHPTRPLQIDDLDHRSNYPVINVTWFDAQAFCRWVHEELISGVDRIKTYQARLPGEAEWEKAARGTDGRDYPWGNQPPDERLCNFSNDLLDVTAVGRYSPQGDSPYGCADMAGNVFDWTHSLFKPYPYQAVDGRENEAEKGERVVRGGAAYSVANMIRCAYRVTNKPDGFYYSRGFRLCISPIFF